MNPTNDLTIDDPRVTAFALGELAGDERAQIEAAIAADATLAAEVEAIRATARDARALFGTAAPGLTTAQRDTILAEAAKPAASRDPIRRWAPFGIGCAAASLLLMFGLQGGVSRRESAAVAVSRVSDVGSRYSDSSAAVDRLDREWKRKEAELSSERGQLAAEAANARTQLEKLRQTATATAQDSNFFGTPANPQGVPIGAHPAPPAAGTSRLSGIYYADGKSGDFRARTENLYHVVLDQGHPGQATTANWNGRVFEFNGSIPTDPTLPGAETQAIQKVQGFLLVSGDGDNGPPPVGSPSAAGRRFSILDRSGRPMQRVHVLLDAHGKPVAVPGPGPVGSEFAATNFGLTQFTEPSTGEDYARAVEQPFLRATDAPLSTFSIDVDTASYSNLRRMLNDGQRPPADAVRVEELLNYFPYQYAPPPAGGDPFAVHLESTACPWNLSHRLVRVGIKGREIERSKRPPMNLVFLLDVSGSMDAPNKLPLVQASMRMLLEELNERDSVAIVTYAGESGVALNPTWCEQKAVIQKAIDDLRAGGSTNGASGISLAYQTAALRFNKDAINRVVLATDGDFNVGATSHEELLALITEKAKSGVFLTALGFGMGNLKDATLELLADKGNGNYGYIDSTKEARKVLVEQASGTLVTIAKDVKIQVEFNPKTVAHYRLVGYDNRMLAAKDFADDTKDAGEIGAGHTVTALYEVVPVGVEDAPAKKPDEESLRYGPPTAPRAVVADGVAVDPVARELMTVKLRWKEPTGTTSVKKEFPFTDAGADYGKASADTKFAASVAAFALLLKGSPYAGNATFDGILEWAGEGLSFDPGGYRKEFVDLVAKARALTAPPATPASRTTR